MLEGNKVEAARPKILWACREALRGKFVLHPARTPGSAVVSLLVEPDRGCSSIVGPLHAPPMLRIESGSV